MEKLCSRKGGWGPGSRRDFDLSPCFEDAVLSAFNCLLILAALVRLKWLASQEIQSRGTRSTALLWTKVTFLALAGFASIFILAVRIWVRPHDDKVQIIQALSQSLAFITAAVLVSQEHLRSRISSTILLIYYPLLVFGQAIRLRTVATTTYIQGSILFGIDIAVPSLIIFAWILECFGPEISDRGIRLEEKDEKESPLATANIYSRWFFVWVTPLMKLGAKKYITEEDLDGLLESDSSAELGRRFQQAQKHHSKSLWAALFTAYGGPYSVAALLKMLTDCLAFLQPQLLRWLLSFIAAYQTALRRGVPGPNPLEGFAAAISMCVAAIIQSVLLHQYFQVCFTTGMRVRAGLVTAIYRKALALSSEEQGKRATGDIVNLMSVDATRLQDLCTYGLMAISGPLQITLAFVSLYSLLGWPAFVGVAIMVFSVPLNTVIARYLKRLQEQQMKKRDARTRLMSELLGNIKSIKLFAWEPAFIKRILSVRNDQELRMLRKIGITTSLNSTLWSGVPLLVAFSSFATAAALQTSPLTSDVIFPAISLFMLLQFPLAMFSQVTSNVIEAIVSVNRLKNFFDAEEMQPDARTVVQPSRPLSAGDNILEIRDGEFAWSQNAKDATLYDISIEVKKGTLFGILGRVGCGKSSLLSAIIGEMRRTSGSVTISGSVAYVPQTPWIQSASVRDNILFSHRYDEEFYGLTLEACALTEDLALMADGDATEVGEKGITLSGGQRARIALARAVYARADLYLLDDVLSAVDSHVARHVFDNVIGPQGILASKARVLVTNSVAFCSQFDNVCYLRRGAIIESGTYTSLMANPESETCKLISGRVGSATPGRGSGSATPRNDDATLVAVSAEATVESEDAEKIGFSEKDIGEALQEKLARRRSFVKAELNPRQITPNRGELGPTSRKEHSEQGRVKRDVYSEYLHAASLAGFGFYVVTALAGQISSILGSFTLRAWSDSNQQSGESGISWYLWLYGLLCLSSTLFSAAGAILIFVLCTLRSAKYLHDRMLFSVLRAPLSFFELTPQGRVLNLFSRDVYVVDSILGRVIQNLVRTVIQVVGIIVVIGTSFPLFLVAVPPLAYFYYLIMIYYLSTSRELKRLDAVSKSPIFAWFSESLVGLSTIRGFGQQQVFMLGSESRIDRNQMCYLPSVSCNRWLATRLELIGTLIIFTTALLSLWALLTTGVDAGLVGLVLSYGLNVTGALNWAVRSGSEVETNIVSVERILHYIRLESEAVNEMPGSPPHEAWPSTGALEFRNYSLRYRPELDLVLKNISMTIGAKEKVGVCGRTGAGKSSLLLALFRIIEPAQGTILIDGFDITKLGLRDLRTAVSIIPQEPQLFEGTLRQNIDPTGEYKDAEIWTALSQSYLKEYVESLTGGLEATVREGGSSMSSGQRQLLCFARALLRKTKILVLDEATSAVDLETDESIQQIIRGPQFQEVTMLTIAHRLNTIIEYDRVLVLDAGQIAEFDKPQNLLADKSSKFYSLAFEAGLTG